MSRYAPGYTGPTTTAGPVKGNRPVGPKMPTKPTPNRGTTPPSPPKRTIGTLVPAEMQKTGVKAKGMAKGGMTGKKGYAKGGMIKANCGASVKPAQKSGKK